MTESNNIVRGYAAIGRVCTEWADIESVIQGIALKCAPFLSIDFEQNVNSFVLAIALAHMDVRNRIATTKVLLEQSSVSGPLRDEIITLLNVIDNDYRIERNRYVHDEWIISDGWADRSTLRPKIIQTQSRTRELSMAQVKHYSSTDEVEAFAEQLGSATMNLISLHDRLVEELSQIAPTLRRARQAGKA